MFEVKFARKSEWLAVITSLTATCQFHLLITLDYGCSSGVGDLPPGVPWQHFIVMNEFYPANQRLMLAYLLNTTVLTTPHWQSLPQFSIIFTDLGSRQTHASKYFISKLQNESN